MSTEDTVLPDHIHHMVNAVMAALPQDPYIPVAQRVTEQKAAISALVSFDPQDALESLLAAQCVSYAHLALHTLRHAAGVEVTVDGMVRLTRSASQLTALSERLSLRLERRRTACEKTPFQQRTARERALSRDSRAATWATVEAEHDAILADDLARAMVRGDVTEAPVSQHPMHQSGATGTEPAQHPMHQSAPAGTEAAQAPTHQSEAAEAAGGDQAPNPAPTLAMMAATIAAAAGLRPGTPAPRPAELAAAVRSFLTTPSASANEDEASAARRFGAAVPGAADGDAASAATTGAATSRADRPGSSDLPVHGSGAGWTGNDVDRT
jgi:hypothetical protein